MSEYIGNRIVPRHDGVWDKAKEYEPLTIVYEESTGDSYMSRKPVPAGTLLSQEEYWAMCSRFSEQMALYRQNTAEEVEQFRKDTAADVEQLRTDTASDVAALRKMTAQDVADITQKVDAANSAVAASKSEMDKTAETLKAQINANVKASTDKNANYAQELVDARVDDEGKTYPTAGDNIRAVGRVRSMQNIMKNWVIKNGYANQNGNLVASESWRVAHMVPVSGDAILVDGQFGYMSGRDDYNNVVCYDMDRKFLGGCFRAESGKVYDNYVITLLPNTRFISVTTNEKLFSKLSVYLYDNMLPMRLLSNYATGWQWMNGSVDIRFTGSKVTVTFPEGKSVYVCRRTNGIQYEQTKLVAENSTSFDFAVVGKWWAIYYDGAEASANETGEKTEVPVIKVENTSGDSWGDLFTKGRFVFAVFFDWNVVYAAPSSSGTVINGIDYGNPAKIANTAMTWHKYRSAKMFLATGQFAIDTVNRTIQVTKRILAVVDNGAYYWISASEEPVPMLDSTEAEKHHMLILAYDSSIDQINLYNVIYPEEAVPDTGADENEEKAVVDDIPEDKPETTTPVEDIPAEKEAEDEVDENEFPTAEELPATIAYGKLKTLMNIRKKPSLDAEVVAVYKKNALVEVVQFCDGWLKIKCAEAEAGVAYVLNSADTYAFTAGRIYTVVPGDNLWKIADKELGSGSRCADIRVLNGLTSNAIRVGMKLLIP